MAGEIIRLCHLYETRGDNPHALNTDLLGVTPIYFVDSDRQALFEILGIDPAVMKQTVAEIPTINPKHKVSSDVYNLATIWAVHKFMTTPGIGAKLAHDANSALLKLLHYKFFTSLMSHNFPYKSNLGIMQQTVSKLSNQFDIKQHGTWKKVIEVRSENVIEQGELHYQTLQKFDNDPKIIYVLSDTQTRLRSKIGLIVSAYHLTKTEGEFFGTYEIVSEIDGEKVVGTSSGNYDVAISNLSNRMQNMHTFIDRQKANLIVNLFSNIRQDMFISVLTRFSEMASLQSKENTLDLVKTIKGETYFIGARVLITELIQKTFRYCEHNRVNMKSNYAIIQKVRDLYRSSRANDEEILAVKRSVTRFIESLGKYTREATIASLTIGFILYIVLQSFEFLS